MHKVLQAFGIVLPVLAVGSLCLPAWSATVVFDRVQVVDVAAGTVGPQTQLFVSDGRIVEAPANESDTVRRIDGQGLFLIPGLAEMHAHVPPAADAQRIDDVLTLFLAHGVTTIRGMLGEPGHLQLRAELARGERIGPRLLTSGPSLNGGSVATPGQAWTLVRHQSEAGYDFLKLHPGLMPHTFEAIARAARGLDIEFAGHVSIGVGLERALAAGQATIDHLDGYAQALVPADHPARRREPGLFGFNIGDAMDIGRVDEWARRTRDAGVWNVPTQTLIENLAVNDLDVLMARPAMRWVDQATRNQWAERVRQMRSDQPAEALAQFVAIRRALILALHESGAGLLLGADAPQIMNVPGDALHHELEIYVAAGLSPAQALATGTLNVARFLKQPAYACLQADCIADLVLLGANPLDDISNVRDVRGVMRAGQWFDRSALDDMLEQIADRADPTGPD
ncbi:MAG: amidohydrolase family protein [Wenzhouxiangellaceae bacterium]|nr:amidohydrolase family protein [Wenzhouxiangellaceae bacterium]